MRSSQLYNQAANSLSNFAYLHYVYNYSSNLQADTVLCIVYSTLINGTLFHGALYTK